MTPVTAYRVGDRYELTCPECGAETVVLALDADVRVAGNIRDELFVFRGYEPYGRSLMEALRLGWCRVLADPSGETSLAEASGESEEGEAAVARPS